MKKTAAVVELANTEFPIATACQLIGLDVRVDESYGKSIKVHCPFGDLHHIDGGADKAMRIYPDSNSAFCFAGCGYFTPVRLVSHAWGRPYAEVAEELLDHAGVKRKSLRERFTEARDWSPDVDRTMLAEALKTYCRRVCPDWLERQFDARVGDRLTRCLVLLDLVGDAAQAQEWLAGSKRAMEHILFP